MILVTGSSGFIGSYVVRSLIERRERVRAFDIREMALEDDRLEFVEGDIRRLEDVERAVSGCDGIIHLAAQIDVGKSLEDPLYDFEENAIGALNCLIAAKKFGVKRFVYSSSAAVYGQPRQAPVSEDEEPIPISPYGISKLTAERYVLNYAKIHKLSAIALRIFNVYGKGQSSKSSYSGVITKFFSRVMSGKPPVIYGDGKQVRDFVHVLDVCNAVIKAYDSDVSGCAINIGTGVGTSVIRLAEMIIKTCNMEGLEPIFEPERKGDIRYSIADVRNAKLLLSWEAKIALEDGLRML
ncbi:MAG: NAD-dependent epimerase/dehydratase family protein [Candidatus Anstonellales archaeon]